ncbi:MAG: TIGR03560 family F420-dependent LLM class oxidoreductase [Halanaeroarchaeum sp.]
MPTTADGLPDVALMIEGQNGLTWERWREVAAIADERFDGLFRSDHFTNPDGPAKASLGLWPSLTWLADNTDAIEFGSLVTPMSFRHPVHTARMARDVDDLAGGRLVLGVGAGWQEREHETFGFELLSLGERFDRYEEGLTVVSRLLREDDPVSFDGEYYHLEEARLVPSPSREGGPDLLVGGNGMNRTIPLAAEHADEYNAVVLPVDEYERRLARLDEALETAGRDPTDVRRSMMTRVVFGRDDEEVERVMGDQDRADLREQGILVGTETEIREQLSALAAAGADRVMLQWLELAELDRLEAMADALAGQ